MTFRMQESTLRILRQDHRASSFARGLRAASLFAALCFSLPALAASSKDPSELVARGNTLYGSRKYDKAELLYRDAQKLSPESPEINLNLGDVAYRKGDYDGAEEFFSKVAESANAGRELRKKALYNLGNVAFMKGEKLLDSDLRKALESYRLGILRYQDVISREGFDVEPASQGDFKGEQDAKFNIEVTRLRIKDILDKLKQQEEKRKEQQQQQEEFIKKLQETIAKQEKIAGDTEETEKRKQQGEDVSQSVDELKKQQAQNKKTTNELGQELQQQIDSAGDPAEAAQQPSDPDPKLLDARNSLNDAEIEQGTAIEHLEKESLPEAQRNEETAAKNLKDALAKLTSPQSPEPQSGQQPQEKQPDQKDQQAEQEPQPQDDSQEKKDGQQKNEMTPQQAKEELAKLRKQANEMRQRNLDEFLRRRPSYRRQRREYEPVDKDW